MCSYKYFARNLKYLFDIELPIEISTEKKIDLVSYVPIL